MISDLGIMKNADFIYFGFHIEENVDNIKYFFFFTQ